MINLGLIRKEFRDSLLSFFCCAFGLIAFVFIFVWAMNGMGAELLNFVSKFPMLAKIFEMGFGISVSDHVSLQLLFAVCFTHLLTLTLCWLFVISNCTRTLVGEIEQGTADFSLTLPVTRTQVYLSNMISWMGLSGLLSLMPMVGILIASKSIGVADQIAIAKYFPVAVNFFALALTVGSITSVISSILSRRTLVVGFVLAICLTSLGMNFVEPFIPALGFFKPVNLLTYFRPVDILRDGGFPVGNVIVLVGFAVVCQIFAVIRFHFRDIPTA